MRFLGESERAPPLEGAPFPAPFPSSCSDLMMTPLFVVIASHSGTPRGAKHRAL